MSTSTVVPMFDPQGVLRDVPYEQMPDAAKAGGLPAVRFQAPGGKTHFVPANQIQDAVKAGGKLLPIVQQDVQHPGFWSALIDDVKAMGKGAYHAAVDPLTDTHEDLVRKLHEEQASAAAEENSPERQAHGAIYRNVTVPAAKLVGVNVPGMEQSAAEGDEAGVYGHAAAVPAVMAATEGAVRGAGAIGSVPIRGAAGSGLRGLSDLISPDVTGIISPRLAHAQRLAGRIADAISVPEGKAVYPGAAYPEAPPAEALHAASLSRGPQPVVDPAQGLGSIPVAKTHGAAGSIAESVASPKVTRAMLEDQLNAALGGRALKQDVPLRQQVPGKGTEAPKLPQGFTPVESSALKGFKYDPQTKEFETITQGGQRYVHGDVSPEDAQAFIDAESKGKAWQQIRENPLVAKVVNGKRIAVKPASSYDLSDLVKGR